MLQNGVDVRTLQEVLGHDHLNTTQIYTHVESDNLRVAAKANPLGKLKKKRSPRLLQREIRDIGGPFSGGGSIGSGEYAPKMCRKRIS